MRLTAISTATFRVLIMGWALPLVAQQGPCDQIIAACKGAGFEQGEASSGTGLQVDCIIPIMRGIAQPAAATRPLPYIAPKVIAACKTNRPGFGQQKEIEIPSFSVGASNPASIGTGTPSAGKAGNDSLVLHEIDSAIGHKPAPSYGGPPIALPPSGSGGTNGNGSLSPAPPPGFDQPTNKAPPRSDSSLTAGAAPRKFRLIVWTHDKPTVLVGLSGATGPGGAELPTPAQVRAQAQMGQRSPGVVIIHAQSGSPASRTLSQLGACNPPACVVEIDRLGASGEVVQKYRFTGGQAVVHSGAGVQPQESVSFTYGKLSVNYIQQGSGIDSASFGW